jgi:hypothetical protein
MFSFHWMPGLREAQLGPVLRIRIDLESRIRIRLDPHQREKPDPDPHQSQNTGAVEAQNGGVETQNEAADGL